MEAKHPQENALLTGVIWKQILLFFLPVALGTFFQQMYNTVDALVVGNFVGMNALGAVGGATASVINLILGFLWASPPAPRWSSPSSTAPGTGRPSPGWSTPRRCCPSRRARC